MKRKGIILVITKDYGINMSQSQELFDFLGDAELSQYYDPLNEVLKIASVQHLKYVEEDDLSAIGMSRPEIRRLKKNYKKVSSHSTLDKMRKILGKSGPETAATAGKLSPSLQRQKQQGKPASRHIIPEDAITTSVTLGGGEFGTVEQGIWIDNDGNKIQVAVKSLSQQRIQSGMTDFLKEASIMHSIDHDNIVRLYGVVLGTETYMLVTELAPLRSLLECLKNEALRDTFPVCQLCDFTIQIADGMSYLENKRLIHRDLAARNILVFDKDTVKVSDFGLSRALGVGSDYYQCNLDGNLKLPIAWCAPESINYLRFTSSSDVWAYGVTLWEIFSYGQQPWALLTGEQILAAVDLPDQQRLDIPDYCPVDIYDIMLKCWAHEPDDRPRFLDILHLLPQAKPQLVQCVRDSDSNFIDDTPDYLHYKMGDIITVLNNRPSYMSAIALWNGVNEKGQKGYFEPADTTPYIEIKTINTVIPTSKKLTRKESNRKSKPAQRKLNTAMISAPQNDLRHTGHIGYDGAVFGDVSFIGGNYDKLPVKVEAIEGGDVPTSRSDDILQRKSSNNGLAEDPMISGVDDDFDDFKLPDLDNNSDFGISLMDDIMKVFSDGNKGSVETETVCHSDNVSPKPELKNEISNNGITSKEDLFPWETNEPTYFDHANEDVITSSFTVELPTNLTQCEPDSYNLSTENIEVSESIDISGVNKAFYNIDIGSDESPSSTPHNVNGSAIRNKYESDNLVTQFTDQDVVEKYTYSDEESSPIDRPTFNTNTETIFDYEFNSNHDKNVMSNYVENDKTTLEDAIALVEEFQQYNLSQQTAHEKPITESFFNQERVLSGVDDHSPSLEKIDTCEVNQSQDRQWSPKVSLSNEPVSFSSTENEKSHRKPSVNEDFAKPLHVNLNIREPQGIPIVRSRGHVSPTEPEEQDTNPLRRLRNSKGFMVPKPRPASKPHFPGKSVPGRPASSHRAN